MSAQKAGWHEPVDETGKAVPVEHWQIGTTADDKRVAFRINRSKIVFTAEPENARAMGQYLIDQAAMMLKKSQS